LERPRRLTLELPLGGQAGIELAVRVAGREVVVDVERHADVVGRRAEVRIELRDVAALRHDQLALLGRLGSGARGERDGGGAGGAERGRALEHIASSQLHGRSSCLAERARYARRNLKLKRRISNCWFGFAVHSTYFWSP